MELPNKQFFRVDEVAQYFGYHPETVRRFIREGEMLAMKPGKGKQSEMRVSRGEILNFAQRYTTTRNNTR